MNDIKISAPMIGRLSGRGPWPGTRRPWGIFRIMLSALPLALAGPLRAGASPEWPYTQELQAAAPGLTRVRLPLETLGAAQPDLKDLRLLDAAGREIPFFIDEPKPQPAQNLPLEQMVMTLEKKRTVVTGVVPASLRTHGFEAITLYTPSEDFLKPLTLEVSADGKSWKTLIRQGPLFKQTGDRESSTLRFPAGHWSKVRITLDDRETPPIRISQVSLSAPGRGVEDLQVFTPERWEEASDSRRTEIQLQLPAAYLPVESIDIEVPDTTFRRTVRLSDREFAGGEFREIQLAEGSLYRVSFGQQKTEHLNLPVHRILTQSLVTLTIENGDSPPLSLRKVRVNIIPRDLIFDAPAAGRYWLCSGNLHAPSRNYDLASLQGTLPHGTFQNASLAPLVKNPEYQAPAAPAAAAEEGSDINTDPWRYRRVVLLSAQASPKILPAPSKESVLWRLELDPQTIAHNGARLEALRLVRRDQQIPYVVDYAGVDRVIELGWQVKAVPDKIKSQWTIDLPFEGLPITRIRATIPNTLFQRSMTLYEAMDEDRDRNAPEQPAPLKEGKPVHILGTALWRRTSADMPSTWIIPLQDSPRSKQLILETENGDNAPIHLQKIEGFYKAPRLLFRAAPSRDPLYLYYGQPEVAAPQYDLNLIAAELVSTPPQEAHLGQEEVLKALPWWKAPVPEGSGRYLFWGVMILVVLGLLLVIAKLLPEEVSR